MTQHERPETTHEAYAVRETELRALYARIESVIGQERHYGIRVWSENAPGRDAPTWRITDPHAGHDGYAFAHYSEVPRCRRLAGLNHEQAPARRAREAASAAAEARRDAEARHAAEAAGRYCDECGVLIVHGAMTASLGLACDVDCYDAMADRPGRHAQRVQRARS